MNFDKTGPVVINKTNVFCIEVIDEIYYIVYMIPGGEIVVFYTRSIHGNEALKFYANYNVEVLAVSPKKWEYSEENKFLAMRSFYELIQKGHDTIVGWYKNRVKKLEDEAIQMLEKYSTYS